MACQCSRISQLENDKQKLNNIITSLGTFKEMVTGKLEKHAYIKDYFDSSAGEQGFHLANPSSFHTSYDTAADYISNQIDTSIFNLQAEVSTLSGTISSLCSEDEQHHQKNDDDD